MKKVYEEPKYIIWSVETDDFEVFTASNGEIDVGTSDVFGDPLENQGPTY